MDTLTLQQIMIRKKSRGDAELLGLDTLVLRITQSTLSMTLKVR